MQKNINKHNFTKKDSSLPYIDDFLLHIQANNYSEKTLYNYERDLETFDNFLRDDLSSLPLDDVTKRTIEQYKAYLNSHDRKTAKNHYPEKKLSSGTINRHLTSLRRYLMYLIDMDYKAPIEPSAIKLLRREKRHPQVSELDELIKLIESPMQFEKNKLVALRNRAMLETLFASGMRISELINLRRNQLDNSGRVFIEGKGKKQRFIYLTDRAQKHLANYLDTRTDELPYLFIPMRGANFNKKTKHISPNYLQAKIKWYRDLLGINVPTSAHSLRHGYATYLAEQGASPVAIQILLGHESLNTTTRYIHASDKYAEES
ncbi:MAG: site-specific recombinase XerD, partial [Candidatus Azotimanducaceae bacterium]